jgi:hypothetical protein
MSKTVDRLEELEQIIRDLPASHPLWKKVAEEYVLLQESQSETDGRARARSKAHNARL